MVKFAIRPHLKLDGNNNVHGGAAVHWDMNEGDQKLHWSVRATDESFADGFSTKGMSLRVRREDRFTFHYDVGDNAPAWFIKTGCTVRDKRVDLKFRGAIKPKPMSSLEAGWDVDDKNRASINYDLTGYEQPDLKRVRVKWTHKMDDLEFTPGWNFATDSAFGQVKYKVDDENSVRCHLDMHTNDAMLEWCNTGSLGGGGEMRIRATTNLDDKGKKMPMIRAEKTWDCDW